MCVLKRANGQLSREAKVVREPKTRESQGNTVPSRKKGVETTESENE